MKGLLFTYILCYGGSVVSLWRPFYGLLIYICFGILKPPELWYWSVPPGNYSRTIAIALILGWALHGFGNYKFGKAALPLFFMLTFAFFFSLSAAFSEQPDLAWDSLEKILKIVLPVFIGVTLVNDRTQLTQLFWTVVLSISFVGYEKNLEYLHTGMSLDRYKYANQMAHAMATGAVMAFYLAVISRRFVAKSTALVCAAICLHTVFIFMSRGAMLGLCAGGMVSFLMMKKSFRSIGALILVAVTILVFAGPSVQQEFFTVTDTDSDGGRIDLWKDMLAASLDKPILGVGHNHWNSIAHLYGWSQGKSGHSLWIQMTCENGWIAGPCYFLFYFSILWLSWKIVRTENSNSIYKYIAMCFVASLSCHIAESFFGTFDRSELPYYVALSGMASLKVFSMERRQITAVSPVYYTLSNDLPAPLR